MTEGTTIDCADGRMELTVGLLGVKVPDWLKMDAGGMGYLRELRINEIERRIIAIEAALAAAGFAGDALAAPPAGPQSGAERATPNLSPSPHKEGDSR